MYHLTCPSCQDKTQSPFVRSGAVVRCAACENKYRIKSAHFEREVHTGPRTIDETDTVLRSDSVDIDPDEVAPVSIDDDGNVVGLSGLSELMRFSDDQSNVQANVDAKRSKDKAKAKQDDAPLPVAKTVKSKAKPKSKPKAKTQPDTPDTDTPSKGRRRALALKRKKRNQLLITLTGAGVVILVIAIILAINLSSQIQAIEDVANNEPANPNTDRQPNPDTEPEPIPEPENPNPDTPDEVRVFAEDFTPSPNPTITFQPPWLTADNTQPPTDVPTVLTPAKTLDNEGWYIMNPPRGAADAPGDTNVELSQITAAALPDGTTLLAGDVANFNTQHVLKAELHIMLLDSTGNVFAETYAPLSAIKAKAKQPIAITIPTRYWKRSRGVRAGVQVTDWANELNTLANLQLAPVGQGPSAALRITTQNQDTKPLRNVTITITATDDQNNPLASFHLQEQGLYIPQNHWLDLVIATPLPPGKQATTWTATVVQN